MNGWSLLRVGLVACVLGVLGCLSAAGPLETPITPDLVAAIAAAGGGGLAPARGQMPDGSERVATLLGRSPSSSGDRVVRVAATVNGQAILEEEVLSTAQAEMARAHLLAEPDRGRQLQEAWKRSLDSLIDRELVLQDALARLQGPRASHFITKIKEAADKEFRNNYLENVKRSTHAKDEEEVRELLKEQGVSLDLMKRHFERNFIMTEYLRNRIFPYLDQIGHVELWEYYEKHPEDFQVADSVEWQDLFIDASRHPSREDARRFAQSLLQRLAGGEDFAKLAETFNNGPKRANAEGSGKHRGEIRPPEVEPVLFQLRPNEIGPLVEIPTGFHIVKITSRQYAGMLPFDDKVQKQIRDKLRSIIGQREMKRIVADLRQKAIIEIAPR